MGDTSLENAKELATHSADKVDAIAALAPYYFRLNNVEKVFFPSSIAVFGDNIDRIDTAQFSNLTPSTVYGMSKVTGENWSKYYFEKSYFIFPLNDSSTLTTSKLALNFLSIKPSGSTSSDQPAK